MIKKVIILIAADILLFTLDIFFIEKPTPDDALGVELFTPLLFIANLLVALLLLAFRKKETCVALLINAVLSPIFFFWVWQIWDDYNRDNYYKNFHFRIGGSRYVINIDKKASDYDIRNNSNRNGSSFDDVHGHYTEKKGIYYLEDSGRAIMVKNDRIIGFPRSLDTVMIDIDSYYW